MKVFATFREIVLDKAVEVEYEENMTIRNLLDRMIEDYPRLEEELYTEDRQLKPHIHVFINGKSIIHGDGLASKIKPDDEIALFPPVAGG